MKLSINPKVERLLDIYFSLPQEKKEALDKMVEAFVKENHNESEETDKTS